MKSQSNNRKHRQIRRARIVVSMARELGPQPIPLSDADIPFIGTLRDSDLLAVALRQTGDGVIPLLDLNVGGAAIRLPIWDRFGGRCESEEQALTGAACFLSIFLRTGRAFTFHREPVLELPKHPEFPLFSLERTSLTLDALFWLPTGTTGEFVTRRMGTTMLHHGFDHWPLTSSHERMRLERLIKAEP